MNKVFRRSVLAAALVALGANEAVAQFEEEGSSSKDAAYFALASTPLAGLPSVFSRALIAAPTGMSFRSHAGFVDAEGGIAQRMFALGLDMPLGPGGLGFTAGLADFTCDLEDQFGGFGGFEGDCGAMYTGSTSLSVPLMSSARGINSKLTLGFDAAVGYSTGKDVLKFSFDFGGGPTTITADASGFAASMGFPFAFTSRGGGIAFSPHLAPRVGYGRATQEVTTTDPSGSTTEDLTESSAIFMLGGGVSVLFERSGVSVDIGFQKSFVKDANITMGLGFSFAPSR